MITAFRFLIILAFSLSMPGATSIRMLSMSFAMLASVSGWKLNFSVFGGQGLTFCSVLPSSCCILVPIVAKYSL